MNTFDDGDSESSSPLDSGVADVITTTIVYLAWTVAVYVLCTFVEHDVDEPATQAPVGTGRTPVATQLSASVASETRVAGAVATGSRAASHTPTAAAQPPADTGDASPAAVPDIMEREKRRR